METNCLSVMPLKTSIINTWIYFSFKSVIVLKIENLATSARELV